MELNPSGEANSRSVAQGFPSNLQSLKLYCGVKPVSIPYSEPDESTPHPAILLF
jgi:hypothetical protein